jgi:23S rRNA (pseudouridine1915-N3)-methyltransferase
VQLKFVWIGATRNPHYRHLETDYLARIERFSSAGIVAVREGRKTDPRQTKRQLEREASRVQKALEKSSYVVCLDERGKERSSRQLSDWLSRFHQSGHQEVAFVVGGHYGLSGPLRAAADEIVSLGKMTLPHELARVLLLEQVYRAFCIQNRIPYHRGR